MYLWFSAKKIKGTVVGFLLRLAATVMGCILACFLKKESEVSTPQEPEVPQSKIVLSSLFRSEDDSLGIGEEYRLREGLLIRELKDEAKFLKACGTLLETPTEIRKASGKRADIKQPHESSIIVENCDEWATGTGSLLETPRCCTYDDVGSRRKSTRSMNSSKSPNYIAPLDVLDSETTPYTVVAPISPQVFGTRVECKTKSVRFDYKSEKFTSSAGDYSFSKASPFPTPLKLSDEMQTPGTIFPAYSDSLTGRKSTRIRSQYVYSLLNPVVDPFPKDLKGEDSDGVALESVEVKV